MSLSNEPSSDLQSEGISSQNKSKRWYRREPRGVVRCLLYVAGMRTHKAPPPIYTQMYLISHLHRVRWDRIIRTGLCRRNTEQSVVEARPISFSLIFITLAAGTHESKFFLYPFQWTRYLRMPFLYCLLRILSIL